MVRATFIKCLQYTKFMHYLFESHNNPMLSDMITLPLFPFYRGKNKNPESKLMCPGPHKCQDNKM